MIIITNVGVSPSNKNIMKKPTITPTSSTIKKIKVKTKRKIKMEI